MAPPTTTTAISTPLIGNKRCFRQITNTAVVHTHDINYVQLQTAVSTAACSGDTASKRARLNQSSTRVQHIKEKTSRRVTFDSNIPEKHCGAGRCSSPTARERTTLLESRSNPRTFKTGCPGVFTDEQRRLCWMQPEDLQQLVSDIKLSVSQSIVTNKQFPLYAETLVEAYLSCCGLDEDANTISDSESVRSEDSNAPQQPPTSDDQVFVLGLSNIQGRGLESFAVPLLAKTRLSHRADSVRRVVTAHREVTLRTSTTTEQLQKPQDEVAQLAAQLSQSSRKFAQILGVADAAAALAEYVGLEDAATTTLSVPVVATAN